MSTPRGCRSNPDKGDFADASPRPALENSGYDAHHSPLWYLIAAAPLWLRPVSLQPEHIRALHWSAALPYLILGLLLGASLWYVARRLFGNAGGYVALALYCFSPGIVRSCALWSAEPEVGAAWGAFGAIFTAIAVAHTLYAPREVVLWNWRRIVLLGLSLALAVGSQFSLIAVVPVALAFMLYLAPTRRLAALAIWGVACGIALLLGYASYFFHARAFWQGIRHASFLGISWKAYAMPQAYHQVLAQLGQSSPALVLALPVGVDHVLQSGPGRATSETRRLYWLRFCSWCSGWACRTIPASVFNSWQSPSCSFLSLASRPTWWKLATARSLWPPSGVCWSRMPDGTCGSWPASGNCNRKHSLMLQPLRTSAN